MNIRSEKLPWDNNGIQAWMTHIETEQLQKLAYGEYMEIGTYQGHSLMSVLPFVDNAIGIDHKRRPQVDKLVMANSKIEYIISKSAKVAHLFKDNSIDVLFIDGDHNIVALDFVYYFPKVKIGGTVIFHDYFGCYPRIIALVDSLPYEIHHLESLAWFVKENI